MTPEGVLEFPSRPGGVEARDLAALEALLFAAGDPVSAAALAEALAWELERVRVALRVLQGRVGVGGVALKRVAGGWQFRTNPEFAPAIQRLVKAKPAPLSRPALEVLAVVAYRQPVTKPEIEAVRGVDSGGVLKSLLDKGLLRTAGRSNDPGRPLLYRTTAKFLQLFGLPDLKSLPTLAERDRLAKTPEEAADDT